MRIGLYGLVFVSVWLGWGAVSAQNLSSEPEPLMLSTENDQLKNEFVVKVHKQVLGNYSVAVEFVSPSNLAPPPYFRQSVKNSGTLIRLKPLRIEEQGQCDVRFAYILGDHQAQADADFVYRLPFSDRCGEVQADTSSNIMVSYFRNAPPQQWKAYGFHLQPGDTVYAARKGRVIRSVDDSSTPSGSGYVQIEQNDGSIATYLLDFDHIMVREGEIVYPDTPLARIGSEKVQAYPLVFFVYFVEDAPLEEKVPFRASQAFVSSFVDPVFATEGGNIRLQPGHCYRARVDPELVQAEMNKREMKKRK